MKCVIIDDEPRAIAILERYVVKIPAVDVLATFDRPLEALAFLKANQPDFIFLDINMPDLDGLELSRLLNNIPVIFTTAYPKYALESYEVNAIDYLLKPIAFPRFLQAIEKVKALKEIKAGNPNRSAADDAAAIFVKSGTKTFRVLIDEIDYLETQGNNMIFHTKNAKIASRLTVNALFEILPINRFLRIHKSFIVPKDKISIIESHQITTLANSKLPIGASYRDGFKKML